MSGGTREWVIALFDLVTYFTDFVADLVTIRLDLVTSWGDLITFGFNLVILSSPKCNNKLLRFLIIRKSNINIFAECACDSTSHSCVW